MDLSSLKYFEGCV